MANQRNGDKPRGKEVAREDPRREDILGLCLRPAGLLQRLPCLLSTRSKALPRARARPCDGSYVRLLSQLARFDLLVVDDWDLAPLGDEERRDFLQLIEDRSETRSTILTSQLPMEKWHDHVADWTIADAVRDRLLHNAYRLLLRGRSRRKEAAE
jgi:hypothetical protein